MRRKIRWQRWEHPLGGGDEWVWDKGQEVQPWSEESAGKPPIRPVLLTAAGLLPMTTYADLNREFDLWIGHTTFAITDGEGGVEETIAETPGVEAVDTLSPIRFRVAFGKLFDPHRVQASIESRLDAVPGLRRLDAATRDKVDQLSQVFKKRHKHWALCVLPNLAIDTFHAKDRDALHRKLDVYEEAEELVGCIVFTQEDFQ